MSEQRYSRRDVVATGLTIGVAAAAGALAPRSVRAAASPVAATTAGKVRGVTQEGRAIEYEIRAGTDEQREDVAADLEGAAEDAWDRYSYLLNTGIAREVARQVLPTSLMTTYYTSCNARSPRSWMTRSSSTM